MGEKQPKKKPLVMDAVKPQGFSKPAEKTAEEKELDEIEAVVAEEATKTEEPAEAPAAEAPAEETPATETQAEETPAEPETQAEETPAETPETPEEEPVKKEPAEPTVSGLDDDPKNQKPQKAVDAPTFAEQLAQTHEQKDSSNPPTAAPKKERKIFKIIRIIIWLFVAIMLPVSIFIIKSSEKIDAYANGTHDAQLSFGQTFFWATIIVGALNLIWGAVRWVMRIVRNSCKLGRIIGKLIGGGVWRFFVFAPIVLVSLIFIAPIINNKVRSDAFDQSKSAKNDILYCGGLCTKKFSLEPGTPKRIYLSTLDSANTKVVVQAPESASISVYKVGESSNQKIAEGNGKAIYTAGSKAENILITAEIETEDESTELVEFVVTVTPEEIQDALKKQEIDFDARNPFRKLENSCAEVNVNSLLDVPGEISGFIKGISSDMDFSDISEKLDKIDTDAQETKKHFEGYLISICTSEFKASTDFAEIRTKLKNTLSSDLGIINMDFYDNNDGGMKISVFGTINAFYKSGKVYALIEIDKNAPALFSINIEPK